MTRVIAASSVVAGVVFAMPLDAQRATFSSRLEAVRVDVSVTSDGRPLRGLTAADFDVLDNGVRQRVDLVATDELPLDLVLTLDVSGSVTGERLEELRAASDVALGELRPGDKAGVITFGQRLSLPVALTTDVVNIRESLGVSRDRERTSMIDAAFAALAHADAGSGRAIAIVLSDGVDTASWLTAKSVIDTARRLDVVLFGIAAGAPKQTPLEAIAEASGGDVIRLRSTAQLAGALKTLLSAFRQRYLLSFVPENVARGGWHTLDVRVKRRGASVKAREGYFGS